MARFSLAENFENHWPHNDLGRGHGLTRKLFIGLFASCALSLFFLLATYPGNLSPDSIMHWEEASRGFLTTIKPPLLSLMQSGFAAILPLERAVAAFTFLQGVMLWFSIFFFLAVVTRSTIVFIGACVAVLSLFPLWPYATLHWTDVWVAIFGVYTITFFELFRRSDYKQIIFLGIGLFFLFLTASTRHNALSILPIAVFPLAFYLCKRGNSRFRSFGLASLSIPIFLLGTKMFLFLPHLTTFPSLVSFAFFNQYLGTIVHASEEERAIILQREEPIYDAQYGEGKLRASLEAYLPAFNASLVWGEDAILREGNRNGFQVIVDSGNFPLFAFMRVVRDSPVGFMKHKLAYVVGQFGSAAPQRYPFDWRITPNSLSLEQKPILVGIHEALPKFLNARTSSLIYQHWVLLVAGLAAVLINLMTLRAPVIYWLYTFSILYALPYVFLETGWEWRYLMPCYVANALAVIALCVRLLETRLWRRKADSQEVPASTASAT